MARSITNQPAATIRRWTVNTDGRLLDEQPGPGTPGSTGTGIAATDAYEPTAAITGQVITRDPHCIHPGRRRTALTCELDHRLPWPIGASSVQNMQALCKRHHLKHHSRRRVTKNRDGSYDWVSPTNHRYSYRPPELPLPIRQCKTIDDEPPPY